MDAQTMEPVQTRFEREEQIYAVENRNAGLTMWTGIGAILCLLLTCFLGSFRQSGSRTEFSLIILAVLLILSVLLFFTAAKRDERWFVVCSLLNHAGIGFAVLLLLDVLNLEIRLRNLALSGLPAAAILFGVVMFYVSADGQKRQKLLYYGIAALGLICAAAVIRYFSQETEFWLCTAVCALLSCTALGALVWTNREPEERSVCKGLAVASFSVYLILLAIAAAALAAAAFSSGSNSGKNKSSSRKSRSFGGSGRSGGSSKGFLSGLFSGSSNRSSAGTGVRTRTFYHPSLFWYYMPSVRSASIDRMEGLNEEQREELRRKNRRRRLTVFLVVALIVVFVIALAVVLGG